MLATIRATPRAPRAADMLKAMDLNANTKRSKREAAVRALEKPAAGGGIDCLVLTLRAGAVGLNLSCANHVVFAAPCLETSVRKQAIGRCHRMGQTRPVTVTTLAMAGTLEEAAVSLLHDDHPARTINRDLVTDQDTLRLAALVDAVWGRRGEARA